MLLHALLIQNILFWLSLDAFVNLCSFPIKLGVLFEDAVTIDDVFKEYKLLIMHQPVSKIKFVFYLIEILQNRQFW